MCPYILYYHRILFYPINIPYRHRKGKSRIRRVRGKLRFRYSTCLARRGDDPLRLAAARHLPQRGRLGVAADADVPCPCLPELDLIRLASSAPSPAGEGWECLPELDLIRPFGPPSPAGEGWECLPELDLIRPSGPPSPAGKADSYPSQERDVLLRTRPRAGTGRDENLASPLGKLASEARLMRSCCTCLILVKQPRKTDEVLLCLPRAIRIPADDG